MGCLGVKFLTGRGVSCPPSTPVAPLSPSKPLLYPSPGADLTWNHSAKVFCLTSQRNFKSHTISFTISVHCAHHSAGMEPGPLACQGNTLPLDPAPASDSHTVSAFWCYFLSEKLGSQLFFHHKKRMGWKDEQEFSWCLWQQTAAKVVMFSFLLVHSFWIWL